MSDVKSRALLLYAPADAAFAEELTRGLEASGDVEVARLEYDRANRPETDEALQRADAVLATLSPEAEGLWGYAATEAARAGKRLIPLLWRPLAEPPAGLRLSDAVRFDGEGAVGGLARLAELLRADLEFYRADAALQADAVAWDAAERADSHLRQGGRLAAAQALLSDRPARAPAPTVAQRAYVQASEAAEAVTRKAADERAGVSEARAAEAEAARKTFEAERDAAKADAKRQVRRARGGAYAALVLLLAGATGGALLFDHQRRTFETAGDQVATALAERDAARADAARATAEVAKARAAAAQARGAAADALRARDAARADQSAIDTARDAVRAARAEADAEIDAAKSAIAAAETLAEERTRTLHEALIDADGVARLLEHIMAQETGGPERYAIHGGRPLWLRGESGVNIGANYDLGRHTLDAFRQDWSAYLPDKELKALEAAIGLRAGGAAAVDSQRLLSLEQELKWIRVPYEIARRQLLEVGLEKSRARLFETLPALRAAPYGCQLALVSLIYNRGADGFAKPGDPWREMRAIRTAAAAGALDRIPAQLRAMTRLHEGFAYLAERRRAEADLCERALKRRVAPETRP